MPNIFDNLTRHLLPDLQHAIQEAYRADFCVGYFNLRGWKQLGPLIDSWPGGESHCVRLLVGMQRPPQEDVRAYYQFIKGSEMLQVLRKGGDEEE